MMHKKLWIVFLPIILWAWWNDADIITEPHMPESYSLSVVSPDTIFMVYRYKTAIDTTYETVMLSTDSGKTWDFYTGLYLPGQECDYRECEVSYYNDTLILIFPQQHSAAFSEFSDPSSYTIRFASYSTILDTVFNMKNKVVRYGGNVYFYAAAIGQKGGDTTKLVVKRSIDHGATWATIIDRTITTSGTIHLKLLDFDVQAFLADSLKIVPTYSYYDENSDTHAIYGEIWGDTLSDNAYIIHGMTILKITGSNHESACDIMDNMTLWAIQDSGKLFFIYTIIDLSSLNTVEYPYNADYTGINGIDMVWWSTFLSSGFNLSYAGNTAVGFAVYFDEITILSGNLSFSDPVLVSDSGYSFYIFNLSPYVKPRIKNTADRNSPYIVWNYDYTHVSGSPPLMFFDSTTYRIDGMARSSSIEENAKFSETPLKLAIDKNILEISLFNMQNEVLNLKLMDISGRIHTNKIIHLNEGRTTLNINSLEPGIYFIILKNNVHSFTGKFIKIE